MPITIPGMVTKKEEVTKLDWSEELSRFDIPVGEPILELTSTTEYRDLSPKSFMVEWFFSLQ